MTIGATFWTLTSMGQYVIAIPYCPSGINTGPYLYSNQGQGNQFKIPTGAPGMRVGAVVGQFLMLGDLYQQQQQTLMTGDGATTTYSGTLPLPLGASGSIFDSQGAIAASFGSGLVTGTGVSGTINYTTGALALTFSPAPASGDVIYANITLEAPYRVQWSAIGDPTNYPTPLTQAALAAQSGFQDLEAEFGQVMYIAGFPLYALIFQQKGITIASYLGGSVVFGFVRYEFTQGLVAHGAAIKMGANVYYLSPEGFMVTSGQSVTPIGTAPDNSSGIDRWFWTNVNHAALNAIRSGYDAAKRCIFWAIPTGTNTSPDTLLIFNPKAQKWSKASIVCETIWTTDDGSDNAPGPRQMLGIMDASGRPSLLNGPMMTGYLESIDIGAADGSRHLCTAVNPIVRSNDLPLITLGARETLQDPVLYGVPAYPDAFSREAEALSSGRYLRLNTQSQSATSLEGGTLMLEPDGAF